MDEVRAGVKRNYNKFADAEGVSATMRHRQELNLRKAVLLDNLPECRSQPLIHYNLCCGRGQDALKLVHRFKDVRSVEIHNYDFADVCLEEFENRVKSAPPIKKSHLRWFFKEQDLSNWSLPSDHAHKGKVHSASCFLAFHYIFTGGLDFLLNVYDLLAPGGELTMLLPDASVITSMMESAGGIDSVDADMPLKHLGGAFQDGHIYSIAYSAQRYKEFKDEKVSHFSYFFSLQNAVHETPEPLVPHDALREMAEAAGFSSVTITNAADIEVPAELRAKMRVADTPLSRFETEALRLYCGVVLRK